MSRDSNGNYTLPSGNPVITGTVISSTWANSTLEDVADALTASLSRDGEGSMLAPLVLLDGSAGVPSLTFTSDTSTGLWMVSAGILGVSSGGSQTAEFGLAYFSVIGSAARLQLNDTAADADEGIWGIRGNGGTMTFNVLSDALSETAWMTVVRTATTVDSIGLTSETFAVGGASSFSYEGSAATATIQLVSEIPLLEWEETDADADEMTWQIVTVDGQLRMRTLNDADDTAENFLTVDRTGEVVDTVTITATDIVLDGAIEFTGAADFTGDVVTDGIFVGGDGTSSTPTFSFASDPDTGMYWVGGALRLAVNTQPAVICTESGGNSSVQLGNSAGSTILLNAAVATTVGAAGAGDALPATPQGYITITILGTARKIPYYLAS